MKKEMELSSSCSILLGEPSKRIVLLNPLNLIMATTRSITYRVSGSFKMHELERYIVKRLLELSSDALFEEGEFKKNGIFIADLSEFSSIMVIYKHFGYYYEERIQPDVFLKKFIAIPIFEVVVEKEDKIVLRYKEY